jgi:hypothetical protein
MFVRPREAMAAFLALRVALFATVLVRGAGAADEHHKYCIVGAGPAGVQLGHYLHKAGRDYVTLERNPAAASWFSKFPVHRQLNSLNRRNTRESNIEFNLRHDWNSLLDGQDKVKLFGNWSKEYWPPADAIVDYINAFAAPQVESGNMQYGQTVKLIEPCAGEDDGEDPACHYMLSISPTPLCGGGRQGHCAAPPMAVGVEAHKMRKLQEAFDAEAIDTEQHARRAPHAGGPRGF